MRASHRIIASNSYESSKPSPKKTYEEFVSFSPLDCGAGVYGRRVRRDRCERSETSVKLNQAREGHKSGSPIRPHKRGERKEYWGRENGESSDRAAGYGQTGVYFILGTLKVS